MSAGIVYANSSCLVLFDGGRYQIRKNDPWDASDPLVKAHPTLFRGDPVKLNSSTRFIRGVEQATAAPGEGRNVKPPAKKNSTAKKTTDSQ